jgi:hypothetical protein
MSLRRSLLWHRRHLAGREGIYPETIAGSLRLRTGDRIPLTAHRTAEVDVQGCRMYELRPDSGDDRLPITEADYLAGGISISIELIPAHSGMRFGFLQEPAS